MKMQLKKYLLQFQQSSTHARWIAIGALYVLSFGLSLLLPNSYFWDDWINYFGKSANEIRGSTGPFSGFSPTRLLLEGWMAEHWTSGFQILSFLLFPIAAIALEGILRDFTFLTSVERTAIVALFLLLPVNSARISMTIFMYSSCYASFFIAWWIYSRSDRLVPRLVSLTFFLISFDTASLLFFMAIPLALSLLNNTQLRRSKLRWIRTNVIFMIAPIAFWFIEPALNPTLDAVRAEYYTPKLSGVLRGLVLLLFLFGFATFGLIVRRWRYQTHRGQIQCLSGFLIIWIGIFPYMSLGHFPNLESLLISFVPGQSDWDSRHQLLMPLGIAVLIVGFLNFLGVPNLWRGLVPILLISSVLNLSFTQEYYLDSIKSSELLHLFSKSEQIKQFENIIIEDQALRFNARGRRIRTYEWDAMLNASQADSRLKSEVSRFVDCNSFKPDAVMTVTADNGKLTSLITRRIGINISVTPLSLCQSQSES
jgi:hypothetical protein